MTSAVSKRRTGSKYLAFLIPVGAVLAALLIGAIMLIALGANPLEGFRELFNGAFGSKDALISTALKATPLLFVGVGIPDSAKS